MSTLGPNDQTPGISPQTSAEIHLAQLNERLARLVPAEFAAELTRVRQPHRTHDDAQYGALVIWGDELPDPDAEQKAVRSAFMRHAFSYRGKYAVQLRPKADGEIRPIDHPAASVPGPAVESPAAEAVAAPSPEEIAEIKKLRVAAAMARAADAQKMLADELSK